MCVCVARDEVGLGVQHAYGVCMCVCVRGVGDNGCTMSVILQRVSDQMPSSSVYGMLKLDSLTEFFR